MDSRQQFEEWAKTGDDLLEEEDFRWMVGADTYYFSVVRYMWEAWQASRESLVVELPDEEPGYMYYAPNIVDALTALGIRTK